MKKRLNVAGAPVRGVPGHPVLFRRALWPHLLALEGDEGGPLAPRSLPGAPANSRYRSDAPLDIDTRQDYDLALAERAAE